MQLHLLLLAIIVFDQKESIENLPWDVFLCEKLSV